MLHAQRAGKDTGFVTTTRVTHATPASLYAHSADRDWECYHHLENYEVDGIDGVKEIAWQLMNREPGNNTKVVLGGGWKSFRPEGFESRFDSDDYLNDYNYTCFTDGE